jgi:hypothetical protein
MYSLLFRPYAFWSGSLNVAPKMSTIAPKMSATNSRTFSNILFHHTRSAVLGVLYRNEGKSYYLRELVSVTETGMGAVQREVKQLLKAGLITKTTSGNQTYYRANSASPAFNEIKSLVTKPISAVKSNETTNRDSHPLTPSDAGSDEAARRQQEIILDAIGETMGRRRLGAKITRSQLIFSAIRNFIEDCRDEEDLRETIDESRMRIIAHER